MRLNDVRDGALLVEFPGASDEEANRAAVALRRSLSAAPPDGWRDAIPAARSLLVLFDPDRLTRERVADELSAAAGRLDPFGGAASRLVRIPVAYGGDAALDLGQLARAASLSEEELVRRHAAAEYRVAFLGFAPGFAYLTGLPRELHAARLPTPRPRVPAGAVAIGGPYTGVYPAAMPGGWRLIGRSPARLFDPGAERPALLSPGDRVRFEPSGDGGPSPTPPPPLSGGVAAFRVVAAGLSTTIQGAPRWGLGASGVPAGGAMDVRSLELANALLDNPSGAPALEIVLAGPELEATAEVAVAFAGADFAAELDGRPAPVGAAFRVGAGARLRFPRARRGARVYLAVEGGFVDGRRPGEPARRLEAGEGLVRGNARPRDRGAVPEIARPAAPDEADDEAFPRLVLRALPGPQWDGFPPAARDRLVSAVWSVSPVSDRRGLRLEGERLEPGRPPEIPPEGTIAGSVQVPGDGLPIVLGPDGPVTGGYPKIATVIESDLPLLGQAAPGAVLRFRMVNLEDATRARREYH